MRQANWHQAHQFDITFSCLSDKTFLGRICFWDELFYILTANSWYTGNYSDEFTLKSNFLQPQLFEMPNFWRKTQQWLQSIAYGHIFINTTLDCHWLSVGKLSRVRKSKVRSNISWMNTKPLKYLECDIFKKWAFLLFWPRRNNIFCCLMVNLLQTCLFLKTEFKLFSSLCERFPSHIQPVRTYAPSTTELCKHNSPY